MGEGKNILKAGNEIELRSKRSTEGQLWDNDDEAIMSWVVLCLKRALLVWERWERQEECVCVCV